MMFKYKNQEKIVDTMIDKQFTTVANMPKVKEDLKEFSKRYTCRDLLIALNEQGGQSIYGNIIKCTVEAFNSSTWIDDTRFNVSLLIDSYHYKVYDITFYCDKDLEINTDPNCIRIDTYTKSE